MYAVGRSRKAKRNLRIRQHLMERCFARGVRFGMKNARWRRLWRVQIQEYLIATAQNIRILLQATKDRFRGIRKGRLGLTYHVALLGLDKLFCLLTVAFNSDRKPHLVG
jgi:hypothetical protein